MNMRSVLQDKRPHFGVQRPICATWTDTYWPWIGFLIAPLMYIRSQLCEKCNNSYWLWHVWSCKLLFLNSTKMMVYLDNIVIDILCSGALLFLCICSNSCLSRSISTLAKGQRMDTKQAWKLKCTFFKSHRV